MSEKIKITGSFVIGLLVGILTTYIIYKPQSNQNFVRAPDSIPESQKILDAPEFRQRGSIQVNFAGEAHLQWSEVAGAKKYKIVIVKPDGEQLREVSTTKTSLYIKDIEPLRNQPSTTFTAYVLGLDEKGVAGSNSEAVQLVATKKISSSIKAPAIKAIVIED